MLIHLEYAQANHHINCIFESNNGTQYDIISGAQPFSAFSFRFWNQLLPFSIAQEKNQSNYVELKFNGIFKHLDRKTHSSQDSSRGTRYWMKMIYYAER